MCFGFVGFRCFDGVRTDGHGSVSGMQVFELSWAPLGV